MEIGFKKINMFIESNTAISTVEEILLNEI